MKDKKFDILNLDNGEVLKVKQPIIDLLLNERIIYYHHNYGMYCHKKFKK